MGLPPGPNTVPVKMIRDFMKDFPKGLTQNEIGTKLNLTMGQYKKLGPVLAGMPDMELDKSHRPGKYRLKPPEPPAPPPAPAVPTAPVASVASVVPQIAVPPSLMLAMQPLVAWLVEQVGARVEEHVLPRVVLKAEERITAIIKTLDLTTQSPPTVISEPESVTASEVLKLKRVTIVGLFQDQEQHINKDYGSKLDIRYVLADDAASSRLKSLAATSDVVVVMIDHVSHYVIDIIKKAHGNLLPCPGGMSNLRRILDERLKENDSQTNS